MYILCSPNLVTLVNIRCVPCCIKLVLQERSKWKDVNKVHKPLKPEDSLLTLCNVGGNIATLGRVRNVPGLARVTWRAAGYAANLARGRNNWPNDCKTKTPVPEELKSLVTEESGVESPVDGGQGYT